MSFKPFVMVLMVAASCAFVNPAGFQTNLMVQKDGGYTFADFARVGLPLTVLVGIGGPAGRPSRVRLLIAFATGA
ncbi:MAG: hypothetical protein WBW33_37705 [Bryobacteraceae bacterium]